MSILTVFNLSTMDAEKYKKAISGLEAAGQGKPKGRLYHIASSQEDGSVIVTDIWESAELLDEFVERSFETGFVHWIASGILVVTLSS